MMKEILMFKIFAWVIGGGCFLAGIGFLFFPKGMNRASQALNKSFHPLEDLNKLFQKEINNDKWIVSSSKALGIISLLVSVVFFVVLLLA